MVAGIPEAVDDKDRTNLVEVSVTKPLHSLPRRYTVITR